MTATRRQNQRVLSHRLARAQSVSFHKYSFLTKSISVFSVDRLNSLFWPAKA